MAKPTHHKPRSVAQEYPQIDRLTVVSARELIFSDNHDAQAYFARVFSGDLRAVISMLTTAFNRYRDLYDTVAIEKQPVTVVLFVHTAVNSVLSSLHLFVSGFPIPAGQLMRHFAESVAMAMMCAVPSCGVYALYDADRKKYPVHKSLDRVTRESIGRALQKALHMDKAAYAQFVQVMKFYDNHSHASALTLSYSMLFTKQGGWVLGSQIDPSKRDQYKRELKHYRHACRTLVFLVEALAKVLPKRQVAG